jgi:hypothetical protein
LLLTSNGLVGEGARFPITRIDRIEALIDGRSQLILQDNTAQWYHLDYAAPGRHEFRNEPTVINGVEWFPIWPDIPDEENRDCNCYSDVFTGLYPSLPSEDFNVKLKPVRSRSETRIIQEPTSGNDYALIIEFDDNSPGGSDSYIVEIELEHEIDGDYSDGMLSPGEYVNVPFCVCLQDKKPFRFFVNVLGKSFEGLLSLVEGAMRPGPPFDQYFQVDFISGPGSIKEAVFDLRTSVYDLVFDLSNPFIFDSNSSIGITESDFSYTFENLVGSTNAKTLIIEFKPTSFQEGDRIRFNADIDFGLRGPGIGFSVLTFDGRQGSGRFIGEPSDPGDAGVLLNVIP